MSQGSPPSFVRRRRLLLVAVAAAAALLWVVQASSPKLDAPPQSASSGPTHAKIHSEAGPRRALPTRMEPDAMLEADAAPPMVCPLVAIDGATSALIPNPSEVLPSFLDVALTPPLVDGLHIALDGETGRIDHDVAARIRHLPAKDGIFYGEDPNVGLIAITLSGGNCTRLQVLVAAEPDPEAVVCPLADPLTLLDIRRVVHASGPRAGRSIRVRPWRSQLVLEDVPPSGDGWVKRANPQPPIPFSWDETGCDAIEPIGTATVTVRITNPPASGPTWIRGCGVSEYLPPGTHEAELQVPATPCALEAWRTDGALRALSPLATVDLAPNQHTQVELPLPEEEMAGLGVRFQPGDDGVSVMGVWPDSPAYAAGLRTGDRILAVDGEAVGGLQDSDFIALGTGPIGSVAVLEVEAPDGTIDELEVERAPLSGNIN